MLCRASLASAVAEPNRSSPKSSATRRKSSRPRRSRRAISRPSPPRTVNSQTPAIAPIRLEPVSPSIARSRRVSQAPTRTGPAKIPSSSKRREGPGAEAEPGAQQRQPLLRPPRTQVEQVEEVGGEDQQRHVGEVAPGLETAPGDHVGGQRQRPDRLDRPGREPAVAQRPRSARASRAAVDAAAPCPSASSRKPRKAIPSRYGSQRRSSGSSRSRSARSSRKASGASATSAAVASTAPSGKASAAPR